MPPHRASFRVYYEDTDAGGVMYHARYLAFAERARSEALRDAGVPAALLAERHGIVFAVRRLSVEYLRPLRLDDLVTVTTEPLERRAASARLRQMLIADAGPAATLELTLAAIRMRDLRPVRIPEPWADVLRPAGGG